MRSNPRSPLLWLLAFLLVAFSSWGVAQQNPASAPQQPATPSESAPDDVEGQRISPQQAQELFRSIDEILAFASDNSGLPIKHRVKRKLSSRDAVVAYLEKHMREDKDAQRLRRSELVLKKFGLLPRDFDLQKFLVALLREQVAGYYDPETRTVYLLDWVAAEQQKPVLAHELTHALQDQTIGLDKWLEATDLASKKNASAQEIASDEVTTARQAVAEGQAMAVLIDYMLAPMGQSLVKTPQVAKAVEEGMLGSTASSPQFNAAPNFLREAIMFPYRWGLDFEIAVLTKCGKQAAFLDTLKNPPMSTRQIMEPDTYLSGEHIDPLPIPDFRRIFRNYNLFDVGAFGEFDVATLVDEYAGAETSRKFYPQWRGGYYYAAATKGDQADPLGLLYVSRWSSHEWASQFAAVYSKSLTKRYRRAREAVAEDVTPIDLDKVESLDGEHTWLTEEGPVVIKVQGDTVMVTESVDPQATEDAEKAIFAPAAMAH